MTRIGKKKILFYPDNASLDKIKELRLAVHMYLIRQI